MPWETQKNVWDSLYCDILFIALVWSQTQSISQVCNHISTNITITCIGYYIGEFIFFSLGLIESWAIVLEGDGWLGGQSLDKGDREPGILNSNSPGSSAKPGVSLLTSLCLFLPCKPGIETFTCLSGGLWGIDWQMTGLPFLFSTSHIKAVLLVGALFCLVSHRATFNDALENQFRL